MQKVYPIRAYHIADRFRLKEIRDKLGYQPKEFSNYEMVVPLEAEDSYLCLYNFGSIVFFNVDDKRIETEMVRFSDIRSSAEYLRTNDNFAIEISDTGQNKALFDKLEVRALSFDSIKIASVVLAQSTALESYEILIEDLMTKVSSFSRRLEKEGEFLEETSDLIKFIGLCLNTRQEVIANFYIVDSPDEVWENHELESLFTSFKAILDIDARYKALEHKIEIIQESIEVIIDLSKSRKQIKLEVTILVLIAVETLLFMASFFVKGG